MTAPTHSITALDLAWNDISGAGSEALSAGLLQQDRLVVGVTLPAWAIVVPGRLTCTVLVCVCVWLWLWLWLRLWGGGIIIRIYEHWPKIN